MKLIFFIITLYIGTFSQENVDTSWSFELRERANLRVVDDWTNSYNELRTRIGFNATLPKNISAFIQLQDSRIYGSESSTLGSLANTDLHQGYVLVDNIFDTNFSIKFGRMEVAYTNQRIVGTVGWHNIGRSFDGSVLMYKSDNFQIDLFDHNITENNKQNDDSLDVKFSGSHMKFDIIDGFKTEAFFYSLNKLKNDDNLLTSGFFINGNITDQISIESQFALQSGSKSKTVDYAGTYFHVKAGFKASDDMSFSAAFETLSGDDGKDSDKNKTFNPFFGTNHKFNGFMDKFFVGGHKINTINGLNDITLSAKLASFTVDFHMFSNAEDVVDPNDATKKLDSSIGNEIDLQYAYKYSDNLKAVFGTAYFLFNEDHQNASETNDLFWYTMLIFNF